MLISLPKSTVLVIKSYLQNLQSADKELFWIFIFFFENRNNINYFKLMWKSYMLIWNYQLFLTHLEKVYVDMELSTIFNSSGKGICWYGTMNTICYWFCNFFFWNLTHFFLQSIWSINFMTWSILTIQI